MNRHVAWHDALALYGDSLRRNSKPVVWLPLMDDDGMAAYPGVSALATGRTRHVFLSAHGLHAGHRWMNVFGMHRRGLDVVVPNSQVRIVSRAECVRESGAACA